LRSHRQFIEQEGGVREGSPRRLHQGELERARLELGPPESADADGEIEALRIEAGGSRDVPVKLEYPLERGRHFFSLSGKLTERGVPALSSFWPVPFKIRDGQNEMRFGVPKFCPYLLHSTSKKTPSNSTRFDVTAGAAECNVFRKQYENEVNGPLCSNESLFSRNYFPDFSVIGWRKIHEFMSHVFY